MPYHTAADGWRWSAPPEEGAHLTAGTSSTTSSWGRRCWSPGHCHWDTCRS